jgi:hypothetical protein
MIEEPKARDELKRVDHLVYVTLKYTRTADVILNIIARLISAFDAAILESLEYFKEKKRIKSIQDSESLRAGQLYKLLRRKGIKKYLDMYALLKKIAKAEYQAKEEYRKHVTLIAKVDKKEINVDVPVIKLSES